MTGFRNASTPSANQVHVYGTNRTRTPHIELVPRIVRAMVTSQGYGLIAELIAAALLIAALTGFFVQRSKPWLVMLIIVAATVLIASST
jgi:hypothetical protein